MATLIYQIFVDRFAASRPIPPAPERAADEGTHRRGWHDPPEEPPRGRDLYGGDLGGIALRLDHVQQLGADAVYLTPIFRAPSNHKYDTADFDSVDEHFGGEAGFEKLVFALKGRNIGLILDGVFNHVGERHRWAREKRPWFRSSVWRGYPHLPELDLQHDEVRRALFGEDGVIARWTRRGATGWRLDCANDLGLDGCRLAAMAARKAGARDGTIGEVMAYPAAWTPPGGLDGVMNYWLRSAAIGLASGRMRAAQVQHALDRLAQEMPHAALCSSWNVLSSHDTPRLATVLDGNARIRLALVLAFAYPGVPMIYYGEEIGMRGGADPANRAGMVWDQARWDAERLALVKQLAGLRRELRALREGRYVGMPQPGRDLVAFARVTERPEETVIFVGNGADAPKRARIFLPLSTMLDALPLVDKLDPTAPEVRPEQGVLEVPLEPHGARLLMPLDVHPSGYRFFR